MSLNLRGLFDGFQSITVHRYGGLKSELETTLILAEYCDCALILALTGLCCVAVDESIGHAEVLGF